MFDTTVRADDLSDQPGESFGTPDPVHRRERAPRVIHVTTAHPADDVRIFERECRSLAATGSYDVYLAASGAIPSDAGVTLVPLAPAPIGRAGRFTAGPRKALALSRLVAADVWHFHDPELLPVALKLARSGHRVIWDAHEDYETQLTGKGSKTWVPAHARPLVRAGTRALLKQIDKHAAGVIAATPAIAFRYSNPRTAIVGNEASLERFSQCRPNFSSRQVLFTGRPSAQHLFNEVVEAVARVPDSHLAVAGREPDSGIWGKAKGVLGDRVRHLGWLDRAGLARAINESALGLLTYADTAAYGDGFPTKGFEFAAGGLPVVATPNRTIVSTLARSHAGFLAEDFSGPALATAIGIALANKLAWNSASAAGCDWAAKEGAWKDSECRLLELYGNVLSVNPRNRSLF